MKRRNFIENLAKGAGALVVLPTVIVACENDSEDNPDGILSIDLAQEQNSALLASGGFIIRNNIIIINQNDTYIALSSVCTHSGCQVSYNASANNLPCPCHGSLFNTSGSVLNGPADAPLKTYAVVRDGDVLDIDLS